MERTLVLIKPDGVERRLIGKILAVYERKGLTITDLKMVKTSRKLAEEHYIEHKGKEYFEKLITFLTEGKVCALVLEGDNIIEMVRKINGDKDPLIADMGSIRGMFGANKTRNLVHASDNKQNAEREIKIWFPELSS